jgi:hypothetical protein
MHRIPRFVISFEKSDDPEYPVLPLTGTLREIEADLSFFLSRHPELTRENFVPYRSARI